MMAQDPRTIIAERPMSRLQIIAVAIAVGLNALDGFDVLSISFASPGIAKEWGVDRAALGVVLSMELIGMAVGSVVLGRVADRIGRRLTVLGCLAVMCIGMAGATRAHGLTDLSLWRVLTGLGIGGMLAAVNALTAEYTNARYRNLSLAIMVIGYPLGAVIGGSVAAVLLKSGDWRSVFEFGAVTTAIFIPLVWFFVPETVHYLAARRPADAVARINHALRRMGHGMIDALPAVTVRESKQSAGDIFNPALLRITLVLSIAYFAHAICFYFILKWSPKIVVDMGYLPSAAAGVLVWANVGGALGGAIFGFVSGRVGLKSLTLITLIGSAVAVAVFGSGANSTLVQLSALAFAGGLFTNSAIVGLYTIFARAFPTHVRASGTGFAIGIGRGGAALSPILAGWLFQSGFSLQYVGIAMGAGSLVAAALIATLKFNFEPDEQPEAA
ncbi:MAG: MFS transporter [Sphingomonas sp. 28-66-16]|nr:MAG: MFS transporter [Sphingomonas sp. 28-66-16]